MSATIHDMPLVAWRKHLAGQRDWLLTLGVSCIVNHDTADGETTEQWAVAEVWNKNDRTFRNANEAITLGFHMLGLRTIDLSNYLFTWPLVDSFYDKVRITGFTIQPAIRDEEGNVSDLSDHMLPYGAICKEWLRRGLAVRQSP